MSCKHDKETIGDKELEGCEECDYEYETFINLKENGDE